MNSSKHEYDENYNVHTGKFLCVLNNALSTT